VILLIVGGALHPVARAGLWVLLVASIAGPFWMRRRFQRRAAPEEGDTSVQEPDAHAVTGETTMEVRRYERMKRCPFCAEKVLAAAIKCKHCGSALGEVAAQISTLGKLPPAADYGWAILGIPLAGTALIWTWIASMSLLQGPSSALSLVVAAVVISTASVCALEASKLGMIRDRTNGTYNPTEWGISILVLWVICYPAYLYNRRKFGVAGRLLSGLTVSVLFLGSAMTLQAAISSKLVQFTNALKVPEIKSPSALALDSVNAAVAVQTEEKQKIGKEQQLEDPARHIAAYCSKLAGESYQLEAACRTEETAAWKRVYEKNEYSNIDKRIRNYCTTSPFDDSFQLSEACMKQEMDAKMNLTKDPN
jgi:hypothetical protein